MLSDDLHAIAGPALLLAAPGTGKTYRLGRRLKYLIEQKAIPPEQVTVITFTSAAARNMRETISDETRPELFVPHSSQPRLICTMHSLGYKIIRESAADLGLQEHVQVIRDELRPVLTGDAAQLCGRSRSLARDVCLCRQMGTCKPEQAPKCEICEKYRAILLACSAVDYDEQMLLACRVLRERSDVRATYRVSARHLLIDEYQDINSAQFEFISILSEGQRDGLFVVGDDDQSIYSWRGGSPTFIRNFREHFGPNATVAPLQRAFRCHKHVLEGATAVVQQYDSKRFPKGQFEYKTVDGPKIQIHSSASDRKEAKEIAKIIEQVFPSRSVLVLFPQSQYSQALVSELRRRQIPFSGGVTAPADGARLIASLATWLKNPGDSLALRSCLEAYLDSPASGLPSAIVRKPQKKQEREQGFEHFAKLWNGVLSDPSTSLWASLKQSASTDRILSPILIAFNQLISLHEERRDVTGFASSIAKELAPWRTTAELLEEATRLTEEFTRYRAGSAGAEVRLMSLQGAKGLQADVVCVIGVEDGVLPIDGSADSVAEQSRLLFVSMTRAITELHLFHARTRSGAVVHRNLYKNTGPPDLRPSRFLSAIPREHCQAVFHRA